MILDQKIQKVQEMNVLMTYVKRRVAFENNQEAEAKADCTEELKNFQNMLLDDLQPKDGKIKSNK